MSIILDGNAEVLVCIIEPNIKEGALLVAVTSIEVLAHEEYPLQSLQG